MMSVEGVWLAVVCCYLRTVNLTAAFLFLLLTAAVRLTVLRLGVVSEAMERAARPDRRSRDTVENRS